VSFSLRTEEEIFMKLCVGRILTKLGDILQLYRLRGSWASVLAFSTQVRGFKPGRSRWIFKGEKNPQHAFLRRGSKAVSPMS